LLSAKVASDKGCCDVIDSSWACLARNIEKIILQTVTHLSSMSSPKVLRLVHNFTNMSELMPDLIATNRTFAGTSRTGKTNNHTIHKMLQREPLTHPNSRNKHNRQQHFKDRLAVQVASEG